MLTLNNSEVTEVTGVQANEYATSAVTPPENPGVTGVTASTKKVKPTIVPKEAERPQYVVIGEFAEEGGFKYRAGVWHFGTKVGRGKNAETTLTQKWICSPVWLDAVTTDASDGNYGRLLRIKTTRGKLLTWSMPMELLKGDCSDLRGELLRMGVEIDPHSREMLASYLQHRAPTWRVQCALQTGWAGTDYKAFVLPDTVIGPMAPGVVYQSGTRGSDEYTMAGTLAGWQAGTAAMAVGNPMLVLGLCAAFVGPLLARCNGESGGIHLIGPSSTGKSSITEAACSVWGGPNFKRSWRATSNGLEGAAALFNDSMLALDEINECPPEAVGEIVYMLGNGAGKQRAGRTGNARAVVRWKCFVLSNGEFSIETIMTKAGQRINAGQSVRLLDIPVQRIFGAWDNLHQCVNGTDFADTLKKQATIHFGHAGRAFLEKLTRDHDGNFCEALETMKALPDFHVADGEGQVNRAATRFAILALAGETATEYGITGWQYGAAIEAAAMGFAAWQAARGMGKANSETAQIVESVISFIERHGDSRFSDADITNDQRAHLVRDRAGWWRNADGGRIYLFTSAGLHEALKGFDFKRALDALQNAGVIDAPGSDGKRAKSMRIDGRLMKLYAVRTEKTDGEAS